MFASSVARHLTAVGGPMGTLRDRMRSRKLILRLETVSHRCACTCNVAITVRRSPTSVTLGIRLAALVLCRWVSSVSSGTVSQVL